MQGGGFLELALELCRGFPGDFEGEMTIDDTAFGTLLSPSFSLCDFLYNKSAMIGVMTKRHPDTDTRNSSSEVGCPPQDIVTLRGDPTSLPPHPPCPLPLGSSSPVPLTNMAGHV